MRYLSSGLGRDGITINSIQFNFIEANQDGNWRNQCLESAMRENRDSTARDGPWLGPRIVL